MNKTFLLTCVLPLCFSIGGNWKLVWSDEFNGKQPDEVVSIDIDYVRYYRQK